jgi:hypothetical protein
LGVEKNIQTFPSIFLHSISNRGKKEVQVLN